MIGRPGRLVLLGHPLGHTVSPVFQNAALQRAAIPLTYEPLDVPRSRIADVLSELRRQHAAGNVTVPYKETVREACNRLTDVARAVGAVNTFWTAVDGALVGDNTDVGGFQAAADRLIGPTTHGQQIALLGAGGAAAAVLYAIERWDSPRVRLYARTPARAKELVKRFEIDTTVAESAESAVHGATFVVNATPVGLRDESVPVDVAAIPAASAVLDLAYRSGETALVRAARARGLRAMDGLVMLVEQGALAFERWFGIAPDRDAMWKAVAQHR